MLSTSQFRDVCREKGLAATHQRQVIYETVMAMHGHPSPEAVYDRVRVKIPAISLATVYKNIHTFLDAGILREASPHHGSLRLDTNEKPHHHLVCVRCRSITDIDTKGVPELALRHRLPSGFRVERWSIEISGVCAACSRRSARPPKSLP